MLSISMVALHLTCTTNIHHRASSATSQLHHLPHMALSSILEKIQQKGVIRNAPASQHPSQSQALMPTRKPQTAERVIDPVVARLKAARKAEREKQEALLRQKKGLAPKKKVDSSAPKRIPSGKTDSKSTTRKDVRGDNLRNKKNPVHNLPPRTPLPQQPKMSFSELMQKASSIDQSKLSILIQGTKDNADGKLQTTRKIQPGAEKTYTSQQRNGTQLPMASGTRKTHSPSFRQHQPSKAALSRSFAQKKQSSVQTPAKSAPAPAPQRAPLPIRKPSSQLQERLKKTGNKLGSRHLSHSSGFKNRAYEEGNNDDEDDEDDDDDLDSFIASEEEVEEEAVDYDRDEIWSMFNRGRKRTYYTGDSDSDDMEATGAEILAEEARSKRDALQEDRREQEEEERLASLKRARKKGRA